MPPHELLAMTIATYLELSDVERARSIFMAAMEQHVSKPPNLKWMRKMEEYDRQLQRRKIRRVVERHRGRW